MSTIFRRLPALAVAAAVAWTAGCGIETQVTGITADADIAEPYLMPTLAHGANLELSHIYFSTTGHPLFFLTAPTDEFTGGRNNSGMRRRWAAMQYHQREDATYSQTNEAGWVAAYSAERMRDVNEKAGTDPNTDPLIAHMYINSAINMSMLAETYCVACIGWGPEGGNLLSGPNPYDASVVVDADSIMMHAITWAEMAEGQAQRAISAGRTNQFEGDWEHFIPQNSLMASYALRARAYLWLEDYAQAAEFASRVPTDFVWNLYSHEENSWRNTQVYYTHHYAQLTVWGSAIGTTFHDVVDPRIPWTKCGDFAPGQVVGGRSRSSSHFVRYTDNDDCYYHTYRYRTYDGDLPNWTQLKVLSYDEEFPIIGGEEMRFIEAEAALRNGQLGAMAGFINEVRAEYGLDPIETPTVAGALEYPNAEDDAWSILDREKLFTLWLEGRRYVDLRRWEHPFWVGLNYATPDELNTDNAGQPRPKFRRLDGSRDWCAPLPDDNECQVNAAIRDTQWCERLYAPGEGG